jgi:hypothetical protein
VGTWVLHRPVVSDSNGYERYFHPEGGAAVVYEHADQRTVEVFINGTRHALPWPDTGAQYGGDSGRPLAYRIRYEAGNWWLYAYVYSGGNNRSEWLIQVV